MTEIEVITVKAIVLATLCRKRAGNCVSQLLHSAGDLGSIID
jgi:hypothetical protein